MRVLTYNIHGWRAPGHEGKLVLDDLAQVIADSGADLVGLNEVFHPLSAADGAALVVLAARLGMQYAFGQTLSADLSPTGIPYGNGILSRWPIMAHAAHHLPAGTDGEPRGLFEARVLLPDNRPFTFYVTHLDHRSEDLRMAQWAAARTWLMRDRGRPHLVVGDLNALAPSDYPLASEVDALRARRAALGWPLPIFDLIPQVLKSGYVDAFASAGVGPPATFPSHDPEIRIDYVLMPERWASAPLVGCRRWEHPRAPAASDHLPVLAEFA